MTTSAVAPGIQRVDPHSYHYVEKAEDQAEEMSKVGRISVTSYSSKERDDEINEDKDGSPYGKQAKDVDHCAGIEYGEHGQQGVDCTR